MIYAILIVGILIFALNVPLFLRKIPMNDFYGVRARFTHKSQENWYDINKAAAKLFMLSALPLIAVGCYGLFRPEHVRSWIFGFLIFPLVAATRVSGIEKRIDARNTAQKGHPE